MGELILFSDDIRDDWRDDNKQCFGLQSIIVRLLRGQHCQPGTSAELSDHAACTGVNTPPNTDEAPAVNCHAFCASHGQLLKHL